MGYENLKLEKGMYNVPGGITGALEKLDPSENYKGTALEGTDAYQRQLKRFDIRVSGSDSDIVEKFFSTTDSAALFPEYVSRAVKTGITEDNVLPQILAATTHINSMDYRSITSDPSNDEKELKDVAEGTLIPETSVHTSEKLVPLHKRGRMLVASYEALKFQRLDLFTVTLKQIGAYIARQQLADAVNVLKDGADAITLADTDLSYGDFITLWNELYPYELNCMVASPDMIKSMLSLSQFQDPQTGINFAGTGKFAKPFGANMIKCADLTGEVLYGFDKNYALEMVVASDVNVDYDRLIDRQLERAAITSIAGFSKIFNDSVKKLEV